MSRYHQPKPYPAFNYLNDRLDRAALTYLQSPGLIAPVTTVPGVTWPTGTLGMIAADVNDVRKATADALDVAAERGIRFLTPHDEEWPTTMLSTLWNLPGLWVKGPSRLDAALAGIAVIGSRAATAYGLGMSADLAGSLAEAGKLIVSGAGLGNDQSAHRAALDAGGTTFAVTACGVDVHHQKIGNEVVDQIAETGLLVSEQPPGSPPSMASFLSRGRVIAALSAAVVVVEASKQSGALATAAEAWVQGRHVAAVPGPVTSPCSFGTNDLIRRGRAQVVTCSRDVLALVDGEKVAA